MPPMPPSPAGMAGAFGLVGDDGLGGEEQRRRDARRVLQRRTRHLGRIDDAGLDEIDVLPVAAFRPNPG